MYPYPRHGLPGLLLPITSVIPATVCNLSLVTTFFHPTPTAASPPPFLASNASQRGVIFSSPPHLNCKMEGVFWPPKVSFSVWSLITNVILTLLLVCGLIYHPQPLPCLECKTEGAVCLPGPPFLVSNVSRRGCFKSRPTTSPPVPLPCFKCESEGTFLVFIHHLHQETCTLLKVT